MSIKVVFDDIEDNLLNKIKSNEVTAKDKVLKQIVKDTDDYVPYRTGKLSSDVSINTNDSSITYNQNYASYAFDPDSKDGSPKTYSKSVHKNAQGYPLEASSDDFSYKWAELYRKELLKDVE